jgi:hypothetical protein
MPFGHSCRAQDPHKWRKRTTAVEGSVSHTVYTLASLLPFIHKRMQNSRSLSLPQTLNSTGSTCDNHGNPSSTRCRKTNATNINISDNRSRSHSARLQRPSSNQMARRPCNQFRRSDSEFLKHVDVLGGARNRRRIRYHARDHQCLQRRRAGHHGPFEFLLGPVDTSLWTTLHVE